MKKNFVFLLTLLITISLISGCAKEEAPAAAPETTAATLAPTVAETVPPTEETVPETQAPTEPIPDYRKLDIDGQIYTLPILATDLTNNGWEFSSDKDFFLGEDYISGAFTRNGIIFHARLTGTPGGTIYDEDVKISYLEFQANEGYALAVYANNFYAGMDAESIIPTMEAVGVQYADTWDFDYGEQAYIGIQEEAALELLVLAKDNSTIVMTINFFN